MENKFHEGMVITTKAEPAVKLIINTLTDSECYCIRVGDRTGKELRYVEDDLQTVDKSYFVK